MPLAFFFFFFFLPKKSFGINFINLIFSTYFRSAIEKTFLLFRHFLPDLFVQFISPQRKWWIQYFLFLSTYLVAETMLCFKDFQCCFICFLHYFFKNLPRVSDYYYSVMKDICSKMYRLSLTINSKLKAPVYWMEWFIYVYKQLICNWRHYIKDFIHYVASICLVWFGGVYIYIYIYIYIIHWVSCSIVFGLWV